VNILFLTSGRIAPSSRFRVLGYVPHLRRLGHRVTVRPSHPPQYESWRGLGWRASQRLRRALRYVDLTMARWRRFDVVYVERELFDDDSWDMEERFRRVCGRLVLDVDDAVFLRHPEKFPRVAQMADVVIAGNPLLAQRVASVSRQVVIVPTVVDLERYQLKPPRQPGPRLTIGWTGTSGGFGYLRLIAGALRELARQREFELRVIANRWDASLAGELSGVNVRFVRWRQAAEIGDLHAFDVGLMPLDDSEWARYKCAFKIVQYMAVGVPAVASPVGANREILRDGENGLLAETCEQWVAALARLLDDEELRRRLAAAGRQTVERDYSVQAQFPRWLDAVSGGGTG
jgi:glycosyltransferase involved in cell wall biosynthesis